MEYILGKDGAKLIVPTELTENTEAYGLKLFESTEWPTLRDARIHRNDCLRRQVGEPYLTSATLHKLSILCLLSYDAQRLYALWIPNLNPVGFCVVRAFCGNYKQRRHKYKSLSPIKLQFTILSLQILDEPVFVGARYRMWSNRRLYAG